MEYNSKIINIENDIKKQLNKEIDRDMKPTNFNIMDTVIPNNQIKSGYQKIVGFQQKVPFQLNFSEENKEIGKITSGTFGPSVDHPISMGYVDNDYSSFTTKIFLEIRGKKISAIICKLPFYQKNYVKEK